MGHTLYLSQWPLINQIIYSFHVMAFFILSGYVIRKRKNKKDSFKSFIWKKFKRLVLPAIIGTILMLPLYFYTLKGTETTIDIIKTIFFYKGFVAYNFPVWFLIIMFYSVVVERLLKIKEKNVYVKLIYLFASLIIGFLIYNFKIFLPFGLDKFFVCFAFFVFGILLREFIDVVKKNQKSMHIILAIVFVVFFALWWLFGIELNPKVSFYNLKYYNYWYFCLSSFFGSCCFFIICYLIAKVTKFFELIGRETVWILSTHYIFVRLLKYVGKNYGVAYTWKYDLIALSTTIILIAVYIVISYFIKKLIKKKKQKSQTETPTA
ncbi:MAG: acyltransferase [Clostridia bacterium]|nr:acyltransferase [Clostridia bacterium]